MWAKGLLISKVLCECKLNRTKVTFMSIPPTKRALGVIFPSGSMYPYDNFNEGTDW